MNTKTMIIVAALAGVWLWHKRKGEANEPSKASDGTATNGGEWLGGWGIK